MNTSQEARAWLELLGDKFLGDGVCQSVKASDLLRALLAAPAVPVEPVAQDSDWQQYAKEGENARQCIERHRGEIQALLKLYAAPPTASAGSVDAPSENPPLFVANSVVAKEWGVEELTPFYRLLDEPAWRALKSRAALAATPPAAPAGDAPTKQEVLAAFEAEYPGVTSPDLMTGFFSGAAWGSQFAPAMEILARASYHFRPGENGEPDDYDIYEEGSLETCANCVPVLIVRATPASEPVASPPVGGEARKYDDVLLPFLAAMRKELHANSRKGDRPGWLALDANTLLLEVYWHAAKLSAAVKNNDGPAIQEHSADVANMAMMVLDVCGGLAWVEGEAA